MIKLKQKDLINEFFNFEKIKNDFNIEENFFALKRKLLSLSELKKDLFTIQLILNLYLYFSNELINKNHGIRILKNELLISIKNHETFRYFLYNNRIDDNTLLKIIPHLKYEHFSTNKIICKEGEDSLNMYFILKGNVSVIKNSNKLNKTKIIKENENFGQWDVIFLRKRKETYSSLNNCHIISISKDIIRKYLQEKLIKGKDELKAFVAKFFKNNGISALFRIERIFQNIKLLYFRKEEIIYKEGKTDKNIYLIYKGEVKLVKKIKEGEFSFIENLRDNILKIQEKAKNINYKDLLSEEIDSEIIEKNNYNQKKLMEESEYKVLSIFGIGSVLGTEISTGIMNKKYTLVANTDYTTIIQIELRYIKDNLKQFLSSLLSIFIQTEKDIHTRYKKIKYIDNLLPDNCQILKIKNDTEVDNSLSPSDNNKIFINEIKKINKKFDINEGGFIKMNDFNINLNLKKNKLKEQLIENKKKFLKLNSIIKKYEKKEEFKEKYKGVKMHEKPYIIGNSNNLEHQFLDNDALSSKNEFFIIKNNNNNKIKLFKNRSEKYFARKTLENFEKIIENYRKRKEFFIIDIYNPFFVKTEKNLENEKKIKSDCKGSKLLKEVIIINKRNEDSIKEYKTKYINRNKSGKVRLYNEKLKRVLNIDNNYDQKKGNKICIINKNILKRLFEKNMIKNKRNFSSNINCFSERRMIYYNTGRYDMPFVSQLKLTAS